MPKAKKPTVTALRKMATGIAGFDEITYGGIPRARATLLMGGTGSGKTVFALQTVVCAVRDRGEPAIFVAFEENARELTENAGGFRWRMEEFDAEHLYIFDAQVTPDLIRSGGFDLTGMLAGLKTKAEAMGAKLIVFDSIDVLLSLLDDPVAERQEIFRLFRWLSDNALTGILTMKLDPTAEPVSEYGFMQFHSDCVVVLSRRLVNRFSMRELQIIKFRGSPHSEDQTPFAILCTGIEVASNSPRELEGPASTERVSTGVPQLDEMLGGGFYRGSSVLITGAPGTAKSILSGAFAAAAGARGERTLFVAFDENPDEIERNLASVNIRIGADRRSGRLQIFSARTEAASAQVHLMRIKKLIAEFDPQILIIDPVSALIRAGGEDAAEVVVERLLYLARTRNITTICTSIVEDKAPLLGASPLYVTTMVDAWIHVSYFIQTGERNRSLNIIKSRGMDHSDQVCELLLSDEGIRLRDVYVSQGEILMGSLRWDRERAEQAEHDRIEAQIEKARRELELARIELPTRIEALKRQLEIQQAELEVLTARQVPLQPEPARVPEKRPAKPSAKSRRKNQPR